METERQTRIPGASAATADTGPGRGAARIAPHPSRVWRWVLCYTLALWLLSILRYRLWLATGDDLGLFQQGLWLLLHGGLTAPSTYTGHPILADAAAYVLLLLAPLYAAGGVWLLLAVQAFAFGLGYLFLCRIGRSVGVSERTAHLVGLAYLIYPTVLGANLFDFHPDAIGVPVLLALIWAALERRRALYAVLFVAAVLVKDTAPIVLFGVGIVLLLRRDALSGALTAVGALTAEFLDVHVVIPGLSHAVMAQWSATYGQLGATPLQGLLHLAVHPQWLFGWIRRGRSWAYLVWMLGPFAGIALTLRLRAFNVWWIPGLLLMEVNLLSPDPVMTSPFNEISVLAVPFLFAGLLSAPSARALDPDRRTTALWFALPGALLAVFAWHQYQLNWRWMPPRPAILAAAVREIPLGAPVAAQNFVLPHLANRAREWQLAFLANRRLPRGTYLVLDPGTTTGLAPGGLIRRAAAASARPGQTRLLFSKDGVTVAELLRPLGPVGPAKAGSY